MTGLEVHLPEFADVVRQSKRLIAQTDPYVPVKVRNIGHEGLASAVGHFGQRWDYAVGKHLEDLTMYSLRLENTAQAYGDSDAFLAQDLAAAWEGSY